MTGVGQLGHDPELMDLALWWEKPDFTEVVLERVLARGRRILNPRKKDGLRPIMPKT